MLRAWFTFLMGRTLPNATWNTHEIGANSGFVICFSPFASFFIRAAGEIQFTV